ncbi:MAG: stage 0 sporulation family protein [Oscillospiraceae bacterium]|nr:stage 0 sporulation family protein [Oscillospiraceae bacterium]
MDEERIDTAPQPEEVVGQVPVREGDTTVEVVDIQFRPGQKVYFFDPAGLSLKQGDHVIMETARGPEYGIVTAGNHTVSTKDVVMPLRSVLRIATAQDEKIVADNRARERKAHGVCLQKIEEHGLDMQLVSVECAFDGSKILFFFTADERVDFRELVKNLASIFHTRIELRQIGVRDKAKMVGGLGICGRPFCCASFLSDFQPVSIKMAKTQNLSLNPTKISGTCGRLMCCLKYEQEAYEDLLRRSPKAESFVDTPEGRGTVIEVDLLRQRVKVRMEDAPDTIGIFSNEEIAVLRNGKAKKTDPPIPADLAPISGNGKRPRKEKKVEEPRFLDPIKFRYREEAVVDEPAPAVPVEEQEGKPSRNRRDRRRKPRPEGAPKAEEAKTEKAPEQNRPEPKRPEQKRPDQKKPEKKPEQKDPEPKPAEPAAEGAESGDKPKRPNNRRRNYHHRKPKSGGGQPQGGA